MSRSFLLARLGPLIGLSGAFLMLLFFLFPLNSQGMGIAYQGIFLQRTIDLTLVEFLLDILGLLGLSAAAFCFPQAPRIRGLAFFVACLSVLLQLEMILLMILNMSGSFLNLFLFYGNLLQYGFSYPFIFAFPLWFPLLPLLSAWGIALGAPRKPARPVLSQQRDPFTGESMEVAARPTQKEAIRSSSAKRTNPWSFGQPQLRALLIGVLLSALLCNLLISWGGPGEDELTEILPAVVLTLFLGLAAGPWVGLLVGGFGAIFQGLLGSLAHLPVWVITNHFYVVSPFYASFSWPSIIGNALIGLLVALPFRGGPGRDLTVRSVLGITLRSTLAVLLGFLLELVLTTSERSASFSLSLLGGTAETLLPTLIVAQLLLPGLLIPLSLKRVRASYA